MCIRDRRHTDNDLVILCHQNFRLFDIVPNFFGVLRTYDKALSAQNALVSDKDVYKRQASTTGAVEAMGRMAAQNLLKSLGKA